MTMDTADLESSTGIDLNKIYHGSGDVCVDVCECLQRVHLQKRCHIHEEKLPLNHNPIKIPVVIDHWTHVVQFWGGSPRLTV